MRNTKTSFNGTGVLHYDKIQNSTSYRVKFKSFKLSMNYNQQRVNEVQSMYKNYMLFKQGKCIKRPQSYSIKHNKQNEQQKYQTNKERVKQNQNLRNRLKSMKNDRKMLFEKIKTNNINVTNTTNTFIIRPINTTHTTQNSYKDYSMLTSMNKN